MVGSGNLPECSEQHKPPMSSSLNGAMKQGEIKAYAPATVLQALSVSSESEGPTTVGFNGTSPCFEKSKLSKEIDMGLLSARDCRFIKLGMADIGIKSSSESS